MRIARHLLTLCAAAVVSMPFVAGAQPSMTDTQGWLDFRGKTPSDFGGALSGVSVGPYRAGYSNASMASAQASSSFDVFCIDWLSGAYDSKISVLTLADASTNSGLLAKFAPTAGNGLTLQKLQQAAWLTQQFDANGVNWKGVHQAIWSLLVPVGGGNPALPALTATAANWVFSSEAAVQGGFTGEQFRVMLAVNDQGQYSSGNQILIVELPEPANLLLVGTALFGLLVVALRKIQRQE